MKADHLGRNRAQVQRQIFSRPSIKVEEPLERKAEPPLISQGGSRRVDSAGRCWYVLSTAPGQEYRLLFELEDLGFSAYIPSRTFWRKVSVAKSHVMREHQSPLFGRYVFVGIRAEDSWSPLMARNSYGESALGISGVLSNDGVPVPIHSLELGAIADYEREGWHDERKRKELEAAGYEPKFLEGEVVEIFEGAFEGRSATIASDSVGAEVRAFVEMFGGKSLVVVPITQIRVPEVVA